MSMAGKQRAALAEKKRVPHGSLLTSEDQAERQLERNLNEEEMGAKRRMKAMTAKNLSMW